MLSTASFSILAVLGAAAVSAHGHVQAWTVNGQRKAGFNPSWPPQYGRTAERPTDNSDQGFADHTGPIVACGGLSSGSNLETWDLTAGSTVTAHWNTWPDSHKGPVTEYMARCPDSGCDGVNAASLDWFKIQEDNFNGQEWPTDRVVRTLNWSFQIPSTLRPGYYLVRHDLVGLHTVGGPQVYPVCFQAKLSSSGTASPGSSSLVKFPAAYNINDGFKTWNIYSNNNNNFVPPGPAVWRAGSGDSGTTASPSPSPSPSSTTTTMSSTTITTTSSTTTTPSSTTTSRPATTTTTSPAATTSSTTTAVQTTSSTTPATPSPSCASGPAQLGGPVPAVTQRDGRWWVEGQGGSHHDRATAVQNACMLQMNRCKDWGNRLPNQMVSSAHTLCDRQREVCQNTAGRKRDEVVGRYAKRTVSPF